MAKLIGTNPDQVPLNQYLGSLAFQNKEAAVIDIVSSNTVTASNAVVSTLFSGSGASLTNINASSISTGTIANARTTAASANGASTIVARDAAGSFTANVVTATLVGDGSGITNLNGVNIVSGSIPNSATTASSSNGASTIVARDANGDFAARIITATTFVGPLVGDGTSLTNLNAANITSGTLSNARTTASSANGASTIVARDANGSFETDRIVLSNSLVLSPAISNTNPAGEIYSGTLLGRYVTNNANTLAANIDYNATGAPASSSDALNVSRIASSVNAASGTTLTDSAVRMAFTTNYGTRKAGLGFITGTTNQILSSTYDVGANLTATLFGYPVTGPRILAQALDLVNDANNVIRYVAENHYMIGNTTVGFAGNPLSVLHVRGTTGIRTDLNSTNDAIVIVGGNSGTSSNTVTLVPASLSASRTLTLPDVTGTVVTTGDTGTVTNTMLAGSITNDKTTASSSNGASTIVARDGAGSFTANAITATSFSGSGASITNLNGTNIASGTVPNARTTAASANGASTIVARDGAGSFTANAITATSFSGSGAALTNLNGTNIASGTVPNARTTADSANGASTIVARDGAGSFTANAITATSFSGSGASITNLNGTNIASGTVPNARTTAASANGASTIVARDAAGSFAANVVTATSFSGSGASITNLNGTNIASGTVSNARTTAASANGASTIVARDASGDFITRGITFSNLYNASGATANTPNIWLTTAYNSTTVPSISIAGTTSALSSISLSYWNTGISNKNSLSFGRSRSATVGTYGAVTDGTVLGTIDFQGDDGNSFSPSAAIFGQAIGTISDGIVPGAITLRTVRPNGGTPLTGLSVSQSQSVFLGGGAPSSTASRVQIFGNIGLEGSANTVSSSIQTNAVLNRSVLKRDVGLSHSMFHNWFYSDDAVFTTGTVNYFSTQDAGKGARHTIGTAQGFQVGSGVHGATNAYGFRGAVDNPTAGGSTATSTISSISLTSNVVTITTASSHGFANNQSVTVATSTLPATSMVAGVEYTIIDIGTTDFTAVGASTQAVFNGSISGTTLTVTGLTSGLILVGCTITGTGIGANTIITGLGPDTLGGPGTYIVNNSTTIGDTVITAVHPGTTFVATGAGTGTGTVRHQTDGSGISITNTSPTTFTYSRVSANIATTSIGGSVIPARRFNLYLDGTASNYIVGNTGFGVTTPDTLLHVRGTAKVDSASGRDAIILTGRTGGTANYGVTVVPATLSANVTLTLPNTTGTVVTTGDTGTVTNTMLAGSITNDKTTAASANGTSTIVARDAGGSFAANVITVSTVSGTGGNITINGSVTSGNSADAVGYKGTPINSQSANYTLALSDQGKTILHPISDNNARTFTIPANSSISFPIGTAISFVNLANNITISITTDTMYLIGSGAAGSRTLGGNGMATAMKVDNTTWVISGNGLV